MKQKMVRVGVGVLIWKNDKIALIKRVGPYGTNTWAPPGGHLEYGESAIETAQRETAEEVGVKIENLEILGFTEDFSVEYRTHYITIWIQCKWVSGELKSIDKEFAESGFFDISDLPMPLFISFKNLVDRKLKPNAELSNFNSVYNRFG